MQSGYPQGAAAYGQMMQQQYMQQQQQRQQQQMQQQSGQPQPYPQQQLSQPQPYPQQQQQQLPGPPQQFARPGMPMMSLPPHMQQQQHQQALAVYAAQQQAAQAGMMGSPGQMAPGMGMGMSPQQRLMGSLPKQGGTPVPSAGKKRGPKPKTQTSMPGMHQAAHHAQSMPPPQGMLPPYVKPPTAMDEEPLADELDSVTARDLAATRYKRRHELMNEILGPVTIAHLGAPPAAYADVDVDAMERQVLELESGNKRLAKEMEDKLREIKQRFESLGKGVAV